MGMSEREHYIKVLENLLSHYKAREKCEGYYDNTLKDSVEALHYAISSLKTDEAYQLMYEGEEIYTKADLVTMLEDLKKEIEEVPEYYMTHDSICVYRKAEEYISDINNVIQQKINNIKETGDATDRC